MRFEVSMANVESFSSPEPTILLGSRALASSEICAVAVNVHFYSRWQPRLFQTSEFAYKSRKSVIHGLPGLEPARALDPLPQARRIVGSGDENDVEFPRAFEVRSSRRGLGRECCAVQINYYYYYHCYYFTFINFVKSFLSVLIPTTEHF